MMTFLRVTLLCCAFLFFVTVKSKRCGRDVTHIPVGYVTGVAGMPPVNVSNCKSGELLKDDSLSNSLECARACRVGDKPKTCYYNFVIERYPISGQACNLCTPDVNDTICPHCQCVPGDGVERMALTVNRMMPGPSIQVCLGDYVVIDVTNQVKEEAITMHWHGVFQNGYQYYDGVPMVTQCPIIFKNTFRYQFPVHNSGTHFYHAHTGLQKMDGIFGSFVVRQPLEKDLNKESFDTDLSSHVVVINDWMHDPATQRYPGRRRTRIGQHPDTLLIDGMGKFKDSNGIETGSYAVFTVQANKRHRFRLVNSFCTTCPAQLTIEGHELTILETDGQPVEPLVVTSIVSFPGERYDFVIETNNFPGAYWIQLRAVDQCTFSAIQQLAILQYENTSKEPKTPSPTYVGGLDPGVVLNPLDVTCRFSDHKAICIDKLVPAMSIDKALLKSETDYKFIIPIGFRQFEIQELFESNQYEDFLAPVTDINVQSTLDGITFQFPPSPLVSQFRDISPSLFCNSNNLPSNCDGKSMCSCMHVLKVPTNATVELILIDVSEAEHLTHPFHLHGHSFYVVSMGQPLGPYSRSGGSTTITADYVKQLEANKKIKRNCDLPPGKDTLAVPNNGYTVIRFIADNPGYWLFHCHFVYHQDVGMELVIQVGDNAELPPVPPNFPKCGNFKPKIMDKEERTL